MPGKRTVMTLIMVLALFYAVFSQQILFNDPLNGSTQGGVIVGSGEFLPDGGWRSTGGRIIYPTDHMITNGYFEATMRGWTAPAGGVTKSHPISGWEIPREYTHYAQEKSFWNWRIGTGYNPFKVLAAWDSVTTREEARVGQNSAVNDGQSHRYRVQWKDGHIAFYFDDALLQEWQFPRMALSRFLIGSDEWYPTTDPAPIISNVKIVNLDLPTMTKKEKEPDSFRLLAIYPNPFNSGTTISFQFDHDTTASLTVYDINGRKIKTLAQHQLFRSGSHTLHWHGSADNAVVVASGVYVIVLRTANRIQSQKAIFVR